LNSTEVADFNALSSSGERVKYKVENTKRVKMQQAALIFAQLMKVAHPARHFYKLTQQQQKQQLWLCHFAELRKTGVRTRER